MAAAGTGEFFRDEMANMVWAVENIVPSQANKGVTEDEMALKEQDPEPFSSESNAWYVIFLEQLCLTIGFLS